MKSKSLGCNASYSVIQVLLLALQQRSEHIKKALDRVSPYALSRFMTLDFNGFKVEEQSKERALLPRLECEVSKIASVHLARPVGGCFFICSLSRMHWAELCRKTTPYSSKTLKKVNLALILAKTRSEQFFPKGRVHRLINILMNTVSSGIQEPNFRFPLDQEFDFYLSQEMFFYTGQPYLGVSLPKISSRNSIPI